MELGAVGHPVDADRLPEMTVLVQALMSAVAASVRGADGRRPAAVTLLRGEPGGGCAPHHPRDVLDRDLLGPVHQRVSARQVLVPR
jgi:hypothetical protein